MRADLAASRADVASRSRRHRCRLKSAWRFRNREGHWHERHQACGRGIARAVLKVGIGRLSTRQPAVVLEAPLLPNPGKR